MASADNDGSTLDDLTRRVAALEDKKKEPLPFWRNTALVGFLGATIAAVPPMLTAIHEYYQTEREVRLSLVKYGHERTISYLDRALSPETKEAKQAQVFRFLKHLPEDDPIHKWAKAELDRVDGRIEELKAEVQDRKEGLVAKQKEIDKELAQIEDVLADAETTEEAVPLLEAAQISLAEKNLEVAASRNEIIELEERAGLAPDRLAERLPKPALRPSLWKIRIGSYNRLDKAMSAADTARAAGARPEIRKQGQHFWVLVGTYGTHSGALAAGPDARRFLGGPVGMIEVSKWCPSGTMRADYFECDPATNSF